MTTNPANPIINHLADELAAAHVAAPEVRGAGGADTDDANDFPLRDILRARGLSFEREDCEEMREALAAALARLEEK